MNKFDVRKLTFSSSATIYGKQNGTKRERVSSNNNASTIHMVKANISLKI